MRYKRLLKMTIILLFLSIMSASCFPCRNDGPYKGRVIDAETGNPIEGVVVLGVWYKELPSPGGSVGSYYDAQETVTDKNGNFEVKGQGLQILSTVSGMHVLIFKAGYGYVGMGMWESLKIDGGLMHKKAAWVGDRAIIPIKMLTMEKMEKRIIARPDIQNDKMNLLTREVNKERSAKGLSALPEM